MKKKIVAAKSQTERHHKMSKETKAVRDRNEAEMALATSDAERRDRVADDNKPDHREHRDQYFDENEIERAKRIALPDAQKMDDIRQAIGDNIPTAHPHTYGGGKLIDVLHGIVVHAKNCHRTTLSK